MAAKASALVMKMINARDQDEGFALADDFTQQQLEVLQLCLQRYEGKTEVQKNHHPPDQLSWVVWIIARMGVGSLKISKDFQDRKPYKGAWKSLLQLTME